MKKKHGISLHGLRKKEMTLTKEELQKRIEFGERVRARRKALKLDQIDLARIVNLSRQSISEIERGKQYPRDIFEFANGLKVDPKELEYGFSDSTNDGKTPFLSMGEIVSFVKDNKKFEKYIQHVFQIKLSKLSFCFKSNDNSMNGDEFPIIPEGYIVVIDPKKPIFPGEAGLFIVNDEPFLRKFISNGKEKKLVSTNKDYKKKIVLKPSDIIVGPVVLCFLATDNYGLFKIYNAK